MRHAKLLLLVLDKRAEKRYIANGELIATVLFIPSAPPSAGLPSRGSPERGQSAGPGHAFL